MTVFTLTPNSAAQALRDNGLDALGVTALRLSPIWGGASPSFDAGALTLTFGGVPDAPWRGILEYLDGGVAFRDVTGEPLAGPAAVLRLHPQAAARFERLAAARYAAGGPQVRTIPYALVVRGATGTDSPRIYDAREALPGTFAGQAISFHDGRGLIVDPVAAAAIVDDLIGAFGALDVTSGGTPTSGAGGVGTIKGLASGIVVHVVDLHGRVFGGVPGGPTVAGIDAGGLVAVAPGGTVSGSGATAVARLRLGWAAGGRMGPGPLAVPDLAAGSLPRQFLRAFAVDLDWHLRGNRMTGEVRGIPAEDGLMRPDLVPQVRDGVTVDYLVDGPDTLASAAAVLGRLAGVPAGGLEVVVSPTLATGVGVPPARGAPAHWPVFPPPNSATGFVPNAPMPDAGITVTRSGTQDLVVEIVADAVPNGASVRVYPQQFQHIEAIAEEPSFVRGDGGAALAAAGGPTRVLLANPFGLLPGDAFTQTTLVFDLVVTPRAGRRRLFAAVQAAIAAGPVPPPSDPYAVPDPIAAVPANVESTCAVPLFGMPRTPPVGGGFASPAGLALAFLSEASPREGPRLPTMARHETVVVTGVGGAAVGAGLDWDAVVTGGRWSRETRSALHAEGNPGNPPGPDVHASGVRVTGALAYDAARHAIRRAQPILPVPGQPPTFCWPVFEGGDNFDPPVPAPAATPGSSSGVLLASVAAFVETPELSLLPDGNVLGQDGPLTVSGLLGALAGALGVPTPSVTVANGDRVVDEVRREFFLSKHGSRDALWSLARALGEADELVYVESAGFSRTDRDGSGIDLVQILADRLAASPNLKVVVCVPRETDFAPHFAPWVRRAILQRTEAVDTLLSAGPGRVAAFHPRGFPGRYAAVRTTSVIVDDVWSLVGATHFRRRGMTFDGSVAVASFDRDLQDGYSLKVRAYRRALMAAKLGVVATDAAGLPTAEWVRLERPASAFGLVHDLLQEGGLGRLLPLWLGPIDHAVAPQSDDVADPDGREGTDLLTLLASLLGSG